MIGLYFGKYLVDEGVLDASTLEDIIEINRNKRLKLGPLAVSLGYMTEADGDKINQIQASCDKRFGDIAVEQGILTDAQVSELIKKQGDSYLIFKDSIIEKGILSEEEFENKLVRFRYANDYSLNDIDAIKSNDVNRIIPIMLRGCNCPAVLRDYVALMARNLVRFIDNKVCFGQISKVNMVSLPVLAAQELNGDYGIFAGYTIADGNDGLLKIANTFAKEEFDTVDLDVLDAVAEFINVSNGLFATMLGEEGISIDMLPPTMKDTKSSITSEGNLYVIPVYVYGKEVTLIVSMKSGWILR